MRWYHFAFGAQDARSAWDFAFQGSGSAYVLVHLKPGVAQRPSFLVAKFARLSWATQTPSDRDVYFEQVWPADANGRITGVYAQPRALWVHVDQIDAMYLLDVPVDEPPPAAAPLGPSVEQVAS